MKVLNGHYEIEKEIGRGGFSFTYLAVDTRANRRKCVIKKFHPPMENKESHPDILTYFKKEALVLEDLGEKIEQIPKFYEFFEEDEEYYLVQEYIKGKTLLQRIGQNGPFSEADTKKFLQSFLFILEAVHFNGSIHRDIKPSNIILRAKDNEPVLIDFGTVKEFVTKISRKDVDIIGSTEIGTPGYRPPEQETGKEILPYSDVYALGMTVVHLLTGKHPKQITRDTTGILGWQTYCPKVTRDFAEILNKAIEPDPEKRYKSAHEMSECLQELTLVKSSRLPREVLNNRGKSGTKHNEIIKPIGDVAQKSNNKKKDPSSNKTATSNSKGDNRVIVLGAVIIAILMISIFGFLGVQHIFNPDGKNNRPQSNPVGNKSNVENTNKSGEAVTLEPPLRPDLRSPSALYFWVKQGFDAKFQKIQMERYCLNDKPEVEWKLQIKKATPDSSDMNNIIVDLELRDVKCFPVPGKSVDEDTREEKSILINIYPKVTCRARLSQNEWLAKRVEGMKVKVRGKILDINGVDEKKGINSTDESTYSISLTGENGYVKLERLQSGKE